MSIRISQRRRKNSLRLREFDYSTSNAYFITIHLQNSNFVLGEINENNIILNETGQLIKKWWLKIPEKYNSVVHDEYKIMPTHLHGIIMLFNDPHWNQNKSSVGADPYVRPNIKQIMQ